VIAVKSLTKVYGKLKAVDDLSFDVGPGEIVGLIGPNGAGKTSTLRCIVGIQSPSTGEISIEGHNIVRDPVVAKRHLAFIADEPHLFDYLTVTEHLRLMGRIYKVPDFDSRSRVLLDELELREKENVLPTELSRGMKQKVSIACALLHEPRALLLDEPLTGLDPLGIRQMKSMILARGRSGTAVLVSSHLLHLVEEICTRVVIVDRGRKVADGTMAEISTQASAEGSNLEEIFLKVTGRDS
jgi:ABC-2 type transport system ATP-binding protein